MLSRRSGGSCFVDVGAHCGLMSLFAAHRAGARTVVAMEPAEEMYEVLASNMKRHDVEFATSHCFQVAVGSKRGVTSLLRDPNNSGATRVVEGPTSSALVPMVTLDEIIARTELSRVDLIKIDVEGHERDVLAGANETIARHRPDLILEYDFSERDTHLIDDLCRLGYDVYVLSRSRHIVSDLVPFKDIAHTRSSVDNLFCFPRPWAESFSPASAAQHCTLRSPHPRAPGADW
ncbi:FkbM family methyltransferase [Micromonospora humi]|nr:FkbM family methyltransferase [Micromonospora humi]